MASGFPYQLTTENFIGIWSSTVIPLTNGKMAVVYAKHGGTVKVKAWDGSNWTVETNTTNAVSMACMLSAVGENDYVHIAFHEDTNYDLVYAKYSLASNSFLNETTLEYGMTSTTGPSITIDSGGNLYVFWYGTPNQYYVYYRKYNASTNSWESRVAWIASTTFKREDYCISFYRSFDGYIGFMFVTGDIKPYKIKFAYFTVVECSSLVVGWNSFNVWNIDVGKTLGQVNASLWLDNVNWTVISLEYPNGTRAVLVYDNGEYIGQENAVVEAGCTFYIYCMEAGKWYHNYP